MCVKFKIGKKSYKRRNLIAKALASPHLRAKVFKNKKKYTRKNTRITVDI